MSKWITKKLSPDICKLTKGQQINRIDLSSAGDYYVLNGGIEPSGFHNAYNTEANTISISEGGNSCGYVAFNKVSFWSGGHNYTLRSLLPEIKLDYLYHFLKYREQHIMGLRVGSGLPNIQRKALANVSICYPQNDTEQNKIAEVLSTVDEAIEKTEAIIEKYIAIKRGLMQDLLNEKNDGMKPYKVQNCFRLRARIGWQGLRADEFKDYGVHLVTGTDFSLGKINWDTCYRVDEYRYKQDTGIQLKEHDLLITKDGTIGKTAIVHNCPEKATLNSGIFVVRAKNENVVPEYLYYLLNSFNFDMFLNNILTGSTIKHLNQEHFYKYYFKAPTPTKQREIVEQLTTIDERIQTERDYLVKLTNTKKGLMQDLLTNKVSVKALLQEEAV